jgi:hypothetical protein
MWKFRWISIKCREIPLEMVNCLNTIILKSFLIIVFTPILHLFYRTIIPPTICTTHIFFINRILKINVSCSANEQNVTLLNMTINTIGTLNLSTLFGALFVFSAFLETLDFVSLKKYVLRLQCIPKWWPISTDERIYGMFTPMHSLHN